jgi:hypothetical protein
LQLVLLLTGALAANAGPASAAFQESQRNTWRGSVRTIIGICHPGETITTTYGPPPTPAVVDSFTCPRLGRFERDIPATIARGTKATIKGSLQDPVHITVSCLLNCTNGTFIASKLEVKDGSYIDLAGNRFELLGEILTPPKSIDYDPSSSTYGDIVSYIPAGSALSGTGVAGTLDLVFPSEQEYTTSFLPVLGNGLDPAIIVPFNSNFQLDAYLNGSFLASLSGNVSGNFLAFDKSFSTADLSLDFGSANGLLRLTSTLDGDPCPVPGPLPFFGVAMAFGFSHKLRKRIKLASRSA